MIQPRKLMVELAVLGGVALLLALLGPFGTFAIPLGRRLVTWLLFVGAGYLFFRPVIAAADALVLQSGLPRWLAIASAGLFAALPTTLVVVWTFAGPRWREVTAGDLAGLYPQVLIVGVAVTVIQLLSQGRRQGEGAEPVVSLPPPIEQDRPDDAASAEEDAGTSASFLDLLPAHLGRDLLSLENEDHYVRARTGLGDALILIRMRDVVGGLDPVSGERVHRSWWVARAAVAEVVRKDRAIALRLVDGLEVPVARGTVPVLRAKGWL